MRADMQDGKMVLIAENQLEQSKLFDFLDVLIRTERPLDMGLLTLENDTSGQVGLFFRVLIEDFDHYLVHILEEQERNEA